MVRWTHGWAISHSVLVGLLSEWKRRELAISWIKRS